jgi:hypothetical protein
MLSRKRRELLSSPFLNARPGPRYNAGNVGGMGSQRREESMAVSITVHLFGKPAWELNKEGEAVEPDELRALGEDLRARLRAAADAIERLTAKGWEATLMLYDVDLSHPYVDTEADARARVEDLGLDPEEFSYMEFEDEEGEEEWDEAAGEDEREED